MEPEPIMRRAPPLPGAQIMSQRWRDLTFLHWAVDPAHEPWPLHRSRPTHLDDSLVAAAGFPGLVGTPPD